MFFSSVWQYRFPLSRLAGCALAGLLSCVVWLGLPAMASDRVDHDLARQALQSGQVLPLRTVLERLERHAPGQVLEVELENESGQWVYEVKVLQSDGRVVKLLLDARDARVLKRRQR